MVSPLKSLAFWRYTNQIIIITKVASEHMIADCITKKLSKDAHFRCLLGL